MSATFRMRLKQVERVQTQEEADRLVRIMIAGLMNFARPKKTPAEAERLVRYAIGYYTGELQDQQQIARILELFKTHHPMNPASERLTFGEMIAKGAAYATDTPPAEMKLFMDMMRYFDRGRPWLWGG